MMAMKKKPTVTVTYDGQILTENTSYKLTYANNKDAGTASVTINGINSLHGQIVKNFIIKKGRSECTDGIDTDGRNN
ncbi:MAG: hypothetical protein ACLTSW_12035 [Coprococcus sp.]